MMDETKEAIVVPVMGSTDTVQIDDEEAGLASKDPGAEDDTSSLSSSTQDESSSCASNDENSSGNTAATDITAEEDFEYPREMYCPLSKQLLCDPVVAADGESYEKSAYSQYNKEGEEDVEHNLYPNRALKGIIDDAVIYKSGSFQASLRRLQHVAFRAMDDFLDPTPSSENTETTSRQEAAFPLSDGFYCPITFNIIHEPVIDPDGNTFEKVAVVNWIRLHGTSPVTRNSLTDEQLYPNHTVRRLLDIEKQKAEDDMHPDILRWKEEPAPKASDLEYGGGVVAAATTDSSGSPPSSSISEERMRRYRRRQATRQLIYNLTGLLVCFLILQFVHNATK
jgi:hypothetical protein